MRLAADRLLSLREAADYLNVAEATLRDWRTRNRPSPPAIKLGNRVKYRLEDLDTWIDLNAEKEHTT